MGGSNQDLFNHDDGYIVSGGLLLMSLFCIHILVNENENDCQAQAKLQLWLGSGRLNHEVSLPIKTVHSINQVINLIK